MNSPVARGPAAGLVYLDHAATTPLRPEAVEAMAPYLAGTYGNPSGSHSVARAAKTALEDARDEVAALLGAEPGEVVFTAGGTEADNLGVKGAARRARSADGADGIVTAAFEHKGVLASCDRLAAEGFRVTRLPVPLTGVVDPLAVADAVDAGTAVVSVMLVNNEVGTIQPLSEIVRHVRERAPGVVVHTDAVQAVPWLDVAEAAATVDLVAISAHKFGGPKGTGALVVRGGLELEPLLEGGGQERGLRSGTSNVAGAVAMARALRVTCAERAADVERIALLRDRLLDGLLQAVPGAFENGDRASKIAGNAHLGFVGIEAETLLVALDHAGTLRRRRLVVLVGRHRPFARARGHGHEPRRCALVDPPQPRVRVHRARRRRRARGDPARGGAAAPCRGGGVSDERAPIGVGVSDERAPIGVGVSDERAPIGVGVSDERAPIGVGVSERVLVAMSGGVDSSVAAALLLEQGHDVTGVTLKLWGGESDSGCCSVADVEDARRVAAQLDIPHYVFNLTDAFDDAVVEPYVRDHAAGRTPNPCVECNRSIKFGALFRRAEALGFDAVATGHHARVTSEPDGAHALRRGTDAAKDQSYVLYMLGQRELARTRLPVGELTKSAVRDHAADLGLRTATKAESMDVCFITKGGRRAFLSERIPARAGAIVDRHGVALGAHDGVAAFTIGQRRGVGVATGERRYVVDVDSRTATVTLGDRSDLLRESVTLRDLTFVHESPAGRRDLSVQTRAHGAPIASSFDGTSVHFGSPQPRVAPGQVVALYAGDAVVGGGIAT